MKRWEFVFGLSGFPPKQKNKVEVHFGAVVEIGGWVPIRVVNFTVGDTQYNTLKNFQKVIPPEEYEDKTVDFTKPTEK